MTISIQAQVRCAQRELAMRLRCYPGWVRTGKITQQKCDEEIAGMTAIVATLQRVQMLWEVSEEIRGPIAPEITAEPQRELKQAALI